MTVAHVAAGQPDRFVRRVFTAAWIWGLVSLVPMLFIESRVAASAGAPVSPPEFYYGFIGVALVFQCVFFVIAQDPARYRPLMLVGVLEKLAFSVPAAVLVMLGRSQPGVLFFAAVDALFGLLFLRAYLRQP